MTFPVYDLPVALRQRSVGPTSHIRALSKQSIQTSSTTGVVLAFVVTGALAIETARLGASSFCFQAGQQSSESTLRSNYKHKYE